MRNVGAARRRDEQARCGEQASQARAALARGARKVYAGARDPASIRDAGLTPLKLDVTSEADVAAAAAVFDGKTNAERSRFGGLLIQRFGKALGFFPRAGMWSNG